MSPARRFRPPPTLHAGIVASVLLWMARTLLGLFVVYPFLLALRASGMASGPSGDAVLFRPGSVLLLESLRLALPLLTAALKTALLLGLLAGLIELVALAMALDLLWTRELDIAPRFRRALRLFPRVLSTGAIVLLAQAAVLLGSSLLGAALQTALSGRDERVSSLAPLAMLGVGLCACGGLGALLDLARAELVIRELGVREALVAAVSCLRERPGALLSGAYVSFAGAVLGYLCAAWATIRLDFSSPSTTTIALAFAGHQAAVLWAIVWRVRWLALALDLASKHQPLETSSLR